MKLSKHFVKNWQARVGEKPTEEQVERVVDKSVIVQRGKSFRLWEGGFFNTLSIFWNPELGLIVTVDEPRDRAVSVLSPEVSERRRRFEKALVYLGD